MIQWLIDTWNHYWGHRVSGSWLDNQHRVDLRDAPEQINWKWSSVERSDFVGSWRVKK
jgi:hypothetical protein